MRYYSIGIQGIKEAEELLNKLLLENKELYDRNKVLERDLAQANTLIGVKELLINQLQLDNKHLTDEINQTDEIINDLEKEIIRLQQEYEEVVLEYQELQQTKK